jgi:hypothetical protein
MPGRLLLAVFAISGLTAATAPETPRAQNVDICAVLSDPITFNGKLVRVTGSVSRGFETFRIGSPKCSDSGSLWIEYGGPNSADGPIWHDGPEQLLEEGTTLLIEGVRTSLQAYLNFRKFDSLTKSLRRGQKARATVVGWVFAAYGYQDDAGETQETGFGPYGIYSLLVIRKVDAVASR